MTAVDKWTVLPACAFALVLGVASAQAQTDQADTSQAGQGQGEAAAPANTDTTEGGATGSATGPITEGKIGEESAEGTSTAFTPGAGLGVLDDETLTTKVTAQGFLNARDFVRADDSIWFYADRDGQPVRIVVFPMTSTSVTAAASAEGGATEDADGGDGGSSAMAEGGAADGVGDATGTAGGDGGSTSVVARQDTAALRADIEARGFTNPRDYQWSTDSVWLQADKDGEVVHIYMLQPTM
jgi:hypothetical protein